MNEQLKKYYRNIRRCLPYAGKMKRQILNRISQDVAVYLEATPKADIDAVQKHFGTPRQIADACIEEMSYAEVLRKVKIKRAIITTICVTAAVALVMWCMTLGAALMDNHKSENGYAEIIVTEE